VPSLLANLVRLQLGEHAERWHDDTIWQRASAASQARVTSGAEWRKRVGDIVVPTLFKPY
jgi:hypothetical protein